MNHIIWTLKEELHARGIRKKPRKNRYDNVSHPIQQGALLNVYWKDEKMGSGPSISLEVLSREVIRFDCFGEGQGHYHIFPYSELRIYFIEKSIEEQIDRSLQEIRTNHSHYLKQHHLKKVRHYKINPQQLDDALLASQSSLLDIVKRIFS